MAALKEQHEGEMEPLTREIDRLQLALDESMKKRLTMITRYDNLVIDKMIVKLLVSGMIG
jgi:hypothetical protein